MQSLQLEYHCSTTGEGFHMCDSQYVKSGQCRQRNVLDGMFWEKMLKRIADSNELGICYGLIGKLITKKWLYIILYKLFT